MSRTPIFATAIAAASMSTLTSGAWAGDQYSFPSPSGPMIAASGPAVFVASPGSIDAQVGLSFSTPQQAYAKGTEFTPLALAPAGAAFYAERFGGPARGTDASGYRFVTQALAYSAFTNYANDYYRLFAPSHAVSTWTDRVAGFVDMRYGGAVDGWTVATYYMPRRGGPRRDSAPDLSLMPTLRAHPELQQDPTFTK